MVSFTPQPLYPWKRASGTQRLRGGVGPRNGLDSVEREKSWSYRDSNSDPSVVHPVASRYTDCAIPALSSVGTMTRYLLGGQG
jgi:hypothetical protein